MDDPANVDPDTNLAEAGRESDRKEQQLSNAESSMWLSRESGSI
jgi:hypothetical protein